MSLEALNAALGNREGTDAQWRLLVLLALDANAEGLVAETSIPAYADRMARKAGGVAGVKAALVKSGLLVVVNEQKDGKRGTYRLALPGLGAAVATDEPPDDSLLPPTADRPKGVKAETWLEFWRAGYPYLPQEVKLDYSAHDPGPSDPAQMVALDALALLGEKRKVASKLVTPRELGLAAVCILLFNRDFEYQGKKGSDYGLGANLTEVVQRIRDRPNWDAPTWARLVESAWRIRWWEKKAGGRRPTPSVIWSPKSFEQVVQDAKAEKESAAADQGSSRRHFTRGARGNE
jgi:hypothetical protein